MRGEIRPPRGRQDAADSASAQRGKTLLDAIFLSGYGDWGERGGLRVAWSLGIGERVLRLGSLAVCDGGPTCQVRRVGTADSGDGAWSGGVLCVCCLFKRENELGISIQLKSVEAKRLPCKNRSVLPHHLRPFACHLSPMIVLPCVRSISSAPPVPPRRSRRVRW
jgi:hypothetical protein